MIEQAIIGTILLQSGAREEALEILPPDPDVFSDTRHRHIYAAILEQQATGEATDLLTLTAMLKRKGVLEACGGAMYVTGCMNRVQSSENISLYCYRLREEHIRRKLLLALNQLLPKAEDVSEDVFELIEQGVGQLSDLATLDSKARPVTLGEAYDTAISYLTQVSQKVQAGEKLLNTGIRDLDRILGGLRGPDFTILAARPGMGKTAFMLHLAKEAAAAGHNVLICSLEQSRLQLAERFICASLDMTVQDLRAKGLDKAGLSRVMQLIGQEEQVDYMDRINIYDPSGQTATDIRREATRIMRKKGLGLIMVDYVQIMRTRGKKGSTRNEEVAALCSELAALAKDLDVPMWVLSQLSRDCEKRANKRPLLSDLRDSGAIEQDASQVVFLYRPAYYDDDFSDKTYTEAIVAKNRHGSTGKAAMAFNGACMSFYEHTGEVMEF